MLTVEELRQKLMEETTAYLDKHANEAGNDESLALSVQQMLKDSEKSLDDMKTMAEKFSSSNHEDSLKSMLIRGEGLAISASAYVQLLEEDALKVLLSKQFSNLKPPTGHDKTIFGLEAIKVTIELEKKERLAQGKKPNECYVIDTTADHPKERETLKQVVEELLKHVPEEGVRHVQLIVKASIHYTTIDFHLERNNCQCLLLDAANDPREKDYAAILANYETFKHVFMSARSQGRTLQRDVKSCSIFALDHAFTIAKLPTTYNDLNQFLDANGSRVTEISWEKFPHALIKNAQFKDFIDEYIKTNQEKSRQSSSEDEEMNLAAYLQAHPFEHIEHEGKISYQSKAIEDQLTNYRVRFESFCQTAVSPAHELFNMVSKHEDVRKIAAQIQEISALSVSPTSSASSTNRRYLTSTSSFRERHPELTEALQQTTESQPEKAIAIKAKDEEPEDKTTKSPDSKRAKKLPEEDKIDVAESKTVSGFSIRPS